MDEAPPRNVPPPLEPEIVVQPPPQPQQNVTQPEQNDYVGWAEFFDQYDAALRNEVQNNDVHNDDNRSEPTVIDNADDTIYVDATQHEHHVEDASVDNEDDASYDGDNEGDDYVYNPEETPHLPGEQTEYHTPDDRPNVVVNDDGDINITIPGGTALTEDQVNLITQMNTPRGPPKSTAVSMGIRQRILSNLKDFIDNHNNFRPPATRSEGNQTINPRAYLPRTDAPTNIQGTNVQFTSVPFSSTTTDLPECPTDHNVYDGLSVSAAGHLLEASTSAAANRLYHD
jgi:hypothetical protein